MKRINKLTNTSEFSSMSQALSSFRIDFEEYANALSEQICKELRDFFKDKPDHDPLFIGSEFLSLFSHSREEDLSDKLAWLLNLSFVRSKDKRLLIFNKLLNDLMKTSQGHIGNVSDMPELCFGDKADISLEVSLSTPRRNKSFPRLDLLILDEKNKIVLGIEVKAGDRNLLKSEEDYKSLKIDYPGYNVNFLLILPQDQLNQFAGNEEDGNEDEGQEVEKRLPNVNICTWENLIMVLQNLHKKNTDEMMFIIMSQMFIGSLEAEDKILGFNHQRIRKILEDKMDNISDLVIVNKYLNYRKTMKRS